MTRLPGGREVDGALRGVERAIRAALKKVNQHASKLLARGDYSSAEIMVGTARSIGEFHSEVEALRSRWHSMSVVPKDLRASGETATPLWEYYRPILHTLVTLGGDVTRREIEEHVESDLGSVLKAADMKPMARGKPRWATMVRRARKYLVREGFLEDGGGTHWRITAAGRRAAQGGVPSTQPDEKRD